MGDVTHLLAIDPGPEHSACVVLDPETRAVRGFWLEQNEEVLKVWAMAAEVNAAGFLPDEHYTGHHLAIEMVASFGMPVGESVFETCLWIGRFIEAWGGEYTKVYRKDVKLALCGSMRAKDANIRQALINRYEPTGGGMVPQVGTKSKPGPLHGFKADLWSALAVAHTWLDMRAEEAGGE